MSISLRLRGDRIAASRTFLIHEDGPSSKSIIPAFGKVPRVVSNGTAAWYFCGNTIPAISVSHS